MTQVRTSHQVLNVELVETHPNCLFVFGDNVVRRGKGGQAVIRDCNNTLGIVTKILPNMLSQSFMSDTDPYHLELVLKDIEYLNSIIKSNKYEYVILPFYGLGAGLAKLKTKAPNIYSVILDKVYKANNQNYDHLL